MTDLADLSDEALPGQMLTRIFELNLLSRSASLRGIGVQIDYVDRITASHPDGYTELHITIGDMSYPPKVLPDDPG